MTRIDNPSIIPQIGPTRASSGHGMLTRLARRLVQRNLDALDSGRITIIEPGRADTTLGRGVAEAAHPLRINDPVFYRRLATGGSLGAAESYIRGEWTCDDLTALLRMFVRDIASAHDLTDSKARYIREPIERLRYWLGRNTRIGSRRNIAAHYDLGNDLFEIMLDETMAYSSAVFSRPDMTLAEAQTEKFDRLCRMLHLGADDHLLEIGTGWGGMAIHAADRYGCRVTTTTISREQHDYAAQKIREAGLDDRVELLLTDYRELDGTYDKLVSIEMIEAVGHAYLPQYFGKCASLVRPGGAMALQAITMPDRSYDRYRRRVDFIQRYVFPGSCCPSMGAMVNAMGRSTDFSIDRVENIGIDYARTLRIWRERFNAKLDDVRALEYPETFVRLWNYYLCYCEAGFAERYIGDVQMLLTRPGGER